MIDIQPVPKFNMQTSVFNMEANVVKPKKFEAVFRANEQLEIEEQFVPKSQLGIKNGYNITPFSLNESEIDCP